MAQPDEYGYFFLYINESTARQGFMEFCQIANESTLSPCSFSLTLTR
jgi:hypothetical protein